MRDKKKEEGKAIFFNLDSDRYIEVLIDDGMNCMISWVYDWVVV